MATSSQYNQTFPESSRYKQSHGLGELLRKAKFTQGTVDADILIGAVLEKTGWSIPTAGADRFWSMVVIAGEVIINSYDLQDTFPPKVFAEASIRLARWHTENDTKMTILDRKVDDLSIVFKPTMRNPFFASGTSWLLSAYRKM